MKFKLALILAGAVVFFTSSIFGQDTAAAKAKELEAKFKETMTAVTMQGRWCSLKDGVLGPEKDDKYGIVSVEKVGGDSWIFNTRLRFRDQELVVPIPVQVKWAGETPVIVVDDLRLPGGAPYGSVAYSARVLIHDNTYAGTWSGGDHGGLIKGVMRKE